MINNYIHTNSETPSIMRKKVLIIGLLAVVICSIIVPAAEEAAESSEYVVTPWFGDSPVTRALPIVGTVGNGQSVDYTYHVSPGSTELEIAVAWTVWPFSNEIEVRIVRPDGSTIGTYGDMYDGQANGQIPIRITSSALMSGDWFITVYGKSITGLQPYTLTINEK
ncbi:MAG: hypothetical protein O0W93_09555 [Methanocorpusculum sp.]|nr:hypothetical protein [Methanocorpusculum sp.]